MALRRILLFVAALVLAVSGMSLLASPAKADADYPVAVNDEFTFTYDSTDLSQSKQFNVLTNDSDPAGEQLSSNGTNGNINYSQSGVTASLSVGGQFNVTVMSTAASQTLTFQYRDQNTDGIYSTPATITLHVVTSSGVSPSSSPSASPTPGPVAVNDTFTGIYANTVDFNVLTNDSDPNGLPLSIVSYTQPTETVQPQQVIWNEHPTVTLSGGVFHVGTLGNATGVARTLTWQYTVSNGQTQATATVTVAYGALYNPTVKVVQPYRKANKKHHQKAQPAKFRLVNPNSVPLLVKFWNLASGGTTGASGVRQIQIPANGTSGLIKVKYYQLILLAYVLGPEPYLYDYDKPGGAPLNRRH